MKTIAVRDLQKQIKQCVDSAQDDRVIITRHGRPAAVLVGVEGTDWETVVVQSDPKFWKLIRASRRQSTITLGRGKRQLGDRPTRTRASRSRQADAQPTSD